MKNRSLFIGVAALVCAALIFSGCEQETETTTDTVTKGAAADLKGLQELLDTDGVYTVTYYGGDLEIGAGTLVIPVGKTVTVDDGGVTLDTAGGLLVVGGTLELPVDEKITGTAGTVVALAALKAKTASDFPEANFIAIQSGDSVIVPAATFAVSGNITISADATSTTNIKAGDLVTASTTALYIIGNLAVSEGIGNTSDITVGVLGNVTVSTAQTTVVKWQVSGTLTTSKTPTTTAGSIYAKTLDLSGVIEATAIAIGEADVETLKTNDKVTITTGTTATGGLTAGTVTGAAVFAASAKITETAFASTAEFKGAATLGDVSFADDVTVTDATALTLTNEKALSLANEKSIKIAGATPITVLTASAATVLTADGATTLTPTSATKELKIGSAALTLTSGALTVPAGATLTADTVALNIGSGASLVLIGAATDGGAKLNGSGTGGKIAAAKTEITGIWQAVGASGTVTIVATDANASTITASATAVLTAGTGGTITQKVGADNNLTIAANTTIDLKGTLASTDTVVGTIKLSETTENGKGGKLTLSAATSVIKVGGDTDAAAALSTAGGAFALEANAATGKITVSSLTNTQIFAGTGTDATGKVNTIKGGTASGTLQAFGGSGGAGTVDIKAGTAVS
jgi:hypothetical protein